MKDSLIQQKKRVPREKWIARRLWKAILASMPISCVDIICQNSKGSILFGWRIIEPYKNTWAMVGGRMLYRENLLQSAKRITAEYGLRFRRLHLVGVYPVSFPSRSDVSIALAAPNVAGKPKIDGLEFSDFCWFQNPPSATGKNYRRMVLDWMRKRSSRGYLRLSEIQQSSSSLN
jgi:ADP-ribose pyrophosphatase YjhB (NUDIX family)